MAYGELTLTEVVNAAGTATARIRVLGLINTWTMTQISVECLGAPSGATCDLRKNGNLVTLLIPQGDVAGGDPPVLLRPSDEMTVNWAGCTPGLVARVLAIYDDGQG